MGFRLGQPMPWVLHILRSASAGDTAIAGRGRPDRCIGSCQAGAIRPRSVRDPPAIRQALSSIGRDPGAIRARSALVRLGPGSDRARFVLGSRSDRARIALGSRSDRVLASAPGKGGLRGRCRLASLSLLQPRVSTRRASRVPAPLPNGLARPVVWIVRAHSAPGDGRPGRPRLSGGPSDRGPPRSLHLLRFPEVRGV